MLSKKYFVGYDNFPDADITGNMHNGKPEFVLSSKFNFWISRQNKTMFFYVPTGMVFDYASIPQFAFMFFLPNDPHYIAAATIHDFLYQSELCPQKQADEIFLSGMLSGATSAIRRAIMFSAVRMFGWTTYGKHSILELERIRKRAGVGGKPDARPYTDDLMLLIQPEN